MQKGIGEKWKEGMYCPNCGTQNNDANKFCMNCGNPLQEIKSQQIKAQEIEPQKIKQEVITVQRPQYSGMACHHRGCTNPVIGQCTGYKESCLRFYCLEHSIDSWCRVCVDRYAHDAAVQAVYDDYLQKAENIERGTLNSNSIWFGVILLIGGPLIFTSLQGPGSDPFQICGSIFMVPIGIAVIYYGIKSKTIIKNRIIKASEENRGFELFFNKYKEQEKASNRQKLLTNLLVVGAASLAIQQYQARQDIHDIAKQMKRS